MNQHLEISRQIVERAMAHGIAGKNDAGREVAEEEFLKACDILAKAEPIEAISLIAPYLWSARGQVRAGLSSLFEHHFLRISPRDWPRLDDLIRRNYCWGFRNFVTAPLESGTWPQIMIGLSHPNGRVREMAIAKHAALPAMPGACAVLIRVNDWVDSIRRSAKRLINPAIGRLDATQRMALVPLLERMRSAGRHGSGDLFGPWLIALCEDLTAESWIQGWNEANTKERAAYLQVLKISGLSGSAEIGSTLVKSNDRRAILYLIKEVMPTLDPDAAAATEANLSASGAVPIRRSWIEYQLVRDPGAAEPLLEKALIDPGASLRQLARYHLKGKFPAGFSDYYLNALADPRKEAVALRALREVDPEKAHNEALKRIHVSSPSLAKAAIDCLSEEWLIHHIEWLLAQAASDLPPVAKAARRWFSRLPRIVGSQVLGMPGMGKELPEDLRAQLIWLSPHFSKWQGLRYLIARSHDPSLLPLVHKMTGSWIARENTTYARLAADELMTLREELARAPIENHLKERLGFSIARAEW